MTLFKFFSLMWDVLHFYFKNDSGVEKYNEKHENCPFFCFESNSSDHTLIIQHLIASNFQPVIGIKVDYVFRKRLVIQNCVLGKETFFNFWSKFKNAKKNFSFSSRARKYISEGSWKYQIVQLSTWNVATNQEFEKVKV